MQSLIQAIKAFFNSLFGGGAGTKGSPNPKKKSNIDSPTTIDIKRYSRGERDILGKMYLNGDFCCYTLEDAGAGQHQLAGTYTLQLREKGGLHATYAYKYGDIHQGLLHLLGGPEGKFPIIRTGNQRSDTGGGIIVGTEVQNENNQAEDREVWNSDVAYRLFYGKIAQQLKEGQPVRVVIS